MNQIYTYCIFHPFMPNELSYLNSLDRSISNLKGVGSVFIITMNYRNPCMFNTNSVDPDQTPRSAASDLSLHCFSISLLWVNGVRLKWVNRWTIKILSICSTDATGYGPWRMSLFKIQLFFFKRRIERKGMFFIRAASNENVSSMGNKFITEPQRQ